VLNERESRKGPFMACVLEGKSELVPAIVPVICPRSKEAYKLSVKIHHRGDGLNGIVSLPVHR
jgi:hypothetical protein